MNPRGCPITPSRPFRVRTLDAGLLALPLAAIVGLAPACRREPALRVVSAEFIDELHPNGEVDSGETIVLRLDAPPPDGFLPENVDLRVTPELPGGWTHGEVERSPTDPRHLAVRSLQDRPPFVLEGAQPSTPAATAFRIDLGDGIWQEVDLQVYRRHPRLERAIWRDAAPEDGAIDGGDRLRLVFDEAVRLAPEAVGRRVRLAEDLLLDEEHLYRLDGPVGPFATWAEGESPREVEIVLGDRPSLRLSLPGRADSGTRIALAATPLHPSRNILAVRGGAGAISACLTPLEAPEAPRPPFPVSTALEREAHTVTPQSAFFAVVAGGRSTTTGELLSDVVVLGLHEPPSVTPAEGRLPHGLVHHTSTRLDGGGDLVDDLVVIAGGHDGRGPVDTISVVQLQYVPEVEFRVTTSSTHLRVPRYDHATVASGPLTIWVTGGRTIDPETGRDELAATAEKITFAIGFVAGPDGSQESDVRVVDHEVLPFHPRAEHSITRLPGDATNAWALVYGGFGPTLAGYAGAEKLPTRSAFDRVLAAPVLLRLDGNAADAITEIAGASSATRRRNHAAVALGGAFEGSILIAGGTERHPDAALDERWQRIDPAVSALNSLLFEFRPEAPEDSRFTILPHPDPDPELLGRRSGSAAVSLPTGGVLLSGGENSTGLRHASSDVYLPERRAIAPLATRGPWARSGHAALLARSADGLPEVWLVGGATTPDGGSGAIEIVPLPR